MIVAALIAGVAVGLICGVIICMLRTQSEIERLETQVEASIPKVAVIKALNGSRMDSKTYRQNRKDNPSIYWNGAVEAVRFQLEDYLK